MLVFTKAEDIMSPKAVAKTSVHVIIHLTDKTQMWYKMYMTRRESFFANGLVVRIINRGNIEVIVPFFAHLTRLRVRRTDAPQV